MTAILRVAACASLLPFVLSLSAFANEESKEKIFRAGVSAIDITPPKFPVRVNGMFTERVAVSADVSLLEVTRAIEADERAARAAAEDAAK